MFEIIQSIFFLLIGFVLLIKGADFFVDGSSSVAKRLKVPSIIIGLTIVAMGTSLPECAVSVTASLSNNNELAISNAVGSNIFNLLVVCGACALFAPLTIKKSTLLKEFPLSILCAVLLLALGFFGNQLGTVDGVIFLLLFAGYIVWMVLSALEARKNKKQLEVENYKILPVWKCVLFIIGGGVAIKFGGDFVVNGASFIAQSFGLSQNLIGLTIVAIGTSLPELVTSIVAARKKEVDMALGNVIGSNIFNILFVLGTAATISPMPFVTENLIDIIVLIAASLLIYLFSWTGKKIKMAEGVIMLLIYIGFSAYICIR